MTQYFIGTISGPDSVWDSRCALNNVEQQQQSKTLLSRTEMHMIHDSLQAAIITCDQLDI